MNIAIDPTFLLFGIFAGLIILIAIYLGSLRLPSGGLSRARGDTGKPMAVLLRNSTIVDVTEPASDLFSGAINFSDVLDIFAMRFPGLRHAEIIAGETLRVASDFPGDGAYLEISRKGDATSIVLREMEHSPADHHLRLCAERRARNALCVLEKAPMAIWKTNSEGDVETSNAEFARLLESGASEVIQSSHGEMSLKTHETRRASFSETEGGKLTWYDVTARSVGGGAVAHYATNADAIVSAEAAQRNFVQTLTKTFAQLSIGLAIFDRKQQLALFNPALIELTMLRADMLSARPSLHSFFDQLRDRRIMPEPRNYKSWRDQLSDMLAAAQDGQYCETWTLPSGLTYRISGKPHPDGAVAFLFEDISAEISLTRRFRAELELSQAVLDAMDCAISVFARSGALTFSNEEFHQMWNCKPDESFIEMTITDVSRIWQEASAPNPVWGEVASFIAAVEDRAEWSDKVQHKTRGALTIHVAPLSGGATLVQFMSSEGHHHIANTADDTARPDGMTSR